MLAGRLLEPAGDGRSRWMAADWDVSPMNRIRLTCRLIRLDRYIVWPTLTVRGRYNRSLESAVIETFDVVERRSGFGLF